MRFLFSVSVAIIILASSQAQAQFELFSGHGIKDSMMGIESKPEVEKSKWPSLKDFSLGEPPKLFNFGKSSGERPLSKMFSADSPAMKIFQPREGGSRPFSIGKPNLPNFSEMFSRGESTRPKFLEQLNAKSKAFMDRTTGWAQRRNDNLRSKTFGSWDAITRGLSRGQDAPTPPPVRTATTPAQKSGIRF